MERCRVEVFIFVLDFPFQAAIHKSFAVGDNLADIAAKGQVWSHLLVMDEGSSCT